MDQEYFDLFGHDKTYKTEHNHSSIKVYDGEEIIGAVMPIRTTGVDGFDEFSILKDVLCSEDQ